MITEAKA